MASKIADVEIQLRAQVATLERDLSKAKGQIDRFSQNTRSAFGRLGDLGRLIPTAAIVTGLGAAAKASIDFADSVAATSQRLGVSTSALQQFRFAAGEADVEVSELERGLATLNRRSGEALSGNKATAQAFESLGVALRDVNGNAKGTEQLFREVGVAIDGLSSQAEKAAASQKLFGDRTGALIPLFRDQGQALDDAIAKAREFGVVIDEDLISSGAEASRAFEVMAETLKTKLQVELLNAVGAIQAMIESFDELETRGERNLLTVRKRALELGNELREIELRMRRQGEDFFTGDLPGGLRGKSALGVSSEELRELIRQQDAEAARVQEILERRASGLNAQGGAGGFIGPREERTFQVGGASADSRKAAAAMAREQAEGERLLQRLREDRLRTEGRTIELLQERFRAEQEVIEQSDLGEEQKRQALEDLAIVFDAQTRAAVEAQDKLGKTAEVSDEAFEEMQSDAEAFGRTVGSVFANMLFDGEVSLRALGQAIIRHLVTNGIEVAAAELAKFAAVGLGGGGELGTLGSILGLASGGVVTRPTFAMIGESGPEAVIPLDRLAAGGGGASEIHIHDHVGARVNVREGRGSRGQRRLDIEFTQAVAEAVATPMVGRSLRSTYGAQRQGQRRG